MGNECVVYIAALGVGGRDGISLGALDAAQSRYTLFRTLRDEASLWLSGQCAAGWEALDGLYRSADSFDALCLAAAEAVCAAARRHGSAVYAVPGGAGFADATVQAVLARCRAEGLETRTLPGAGYAEAAALTAGGLDCAAVCPAGLLRRELIDTRLPLVITEVDDAVTAGEIKLLLLERYPDDARVAVWDGQASLSVPLPEADRLKNYSNKVTFLLPAIDIMSLSSYDFNRLVELIAILRGCGENGREGCPWDMEQTHATLRTTLLEETYEVLDAIDAGDDASLADELGDLLLQVVFHAQIAAEQASFTMLDVTTAVCAKMIRRHPHIFGSAHADSADDVLAVWEKLKRDEKRQSSVAESLRDIPRGMPALMRAAKLLRKSGEAAAPDAADQMAAEAVLRFRTGGEDELGELLFAVCRAARARGLDPELALGRACERFLRRWEDGNGHTSG